MFKKRSKKGLSHVDWAMSLAIFLLYLAWFFIFVKPMFSPSQSMDVLLDVLDDGVRDALFQDISRIKVFVPGSLHSDYEPIIIPFTQDWPAADIAHSADHFVIDSGRMFFLANLSNTSVFRIYYPHKAIRMIPLFPMMADEGRAGFGSFSAYFDGGLLDRVSFMGEPRLSGFSVEVDETDIGGEGDFGNSTLLAKYVRAGDNVNMTSYFISENSRIYSYISSADFRNHSVAVEFSAYNYTYFYFSPMSRGEVDYGIGPSCRYYESDFLDLYGPDSGLLVTFGRNISFRLCANETNVLVRLEFDLTAGDEDSMVIMLHSGGLGEVGGYPLNPVVGVTETLRTVSAKQVSLMRNRDYSYLKQVFRFPGDRDFNVAVSGDVVSASYGAPQPEAEDIYARKIEGVIIDDFYEPRRALITLTVW
ncbi:hypothetical protein JW898_02880 [Candidatus Woesearchaeota archaeon]|nr:hypothetical protein [Candidatus Woesearchaeota archaeon]